MLGFWGLKAGRAGADPGGVGSSRVGLTDCIIYKFRENKIETEVGKQTSILVEIEAVEGTLHVLSRNHLVQGPGFRVWVSGLSVQCVGLRVWG